MDTQTFTWVLVALSLASGLVAGVFLTFSDFVMRSLAAARPATGAEAMQIINRKVLASVFMVLLLGLVPISALAAIYGWMALPQAVLGWLAAAAGLYVTGVFAVTVFKNVPRNTALDAMPLGGDSAQAYWPDYVRGWVRWNHIRTLSALGTAALYAIAAVTLAQSA